MHIQAYIILYSSRTLEVTHLASLQSSRVMPLFSFIQTLKSSGVGCQILLLAQTWSPPLHTPQKNKFVSHYTHSEAHNVPHDPLWVYLYWYSPSQKDIGSTYASSVIPTIGVYYSGCWRITFVTTSGVTVGDAVRSAVTLFAFTVQH